MERLEIVGYNGKINAGKLKIKGGVGGEFASNGKINAGGIEINGGVGDWLEIMGDIVNGKRDNKSRGTEQMWRNSVKGLIKMQFLKMKNNKKYLF